MNWIVKVENLSKIYRLGAGATQHGTLYEQISKRVKNYLPNRRALLKEDSLDKSAEKVVVSDSQTEGLPPGYFWALKDISFQVNPGERIGLIGQNGSGKSTLLKILSRITTQSHGEFRYRGHLISLLEVGTGFHPELSGRENIYLNAAINGMSRQQIKSRFKEIVDFSELGSQIDTPVKRYSSGMYMRLAFSVAAFLESEILLVDEVLAVGDQGFQKKCKEKMLEVANDGRSVIFVSHDMSAIESICKKTIEISHGKIVEVKDVIINKQNENTQAVELLQPGQELYHNAVEVITSEKKKSTLCAEQIFENNSIKTCTKDSTIELCSAKILNDEGFLQEIFTVNESFHIEIQLKVSKVKSKFNVRLDLSSSDGQLVFSSMDHHCYNPKNGSREVGLYKEVVTIPKEYLNEGQFNVSIYVIDSDNNQNNINRINCLSIKIFDDLLPIGVRSNWESSWPNSLLRPNLKWKVEKCSVNEDRLVAGSLFDLEVIK